MNRLGNLGWSPIPSGLQSMVAQGVADAATAAKTAGATAVAPPPPPPSNMTEKLLFAAGGLIVGLGIGYHMGKGK